MPPTEALRRVAGWLACPVCRAGMAIADAGLACANGHRFDVARQGYVNLLGRSAPPNADSADMLAARARFLAAGHYSPVSDAVATALGGCDRLLEVGAGTGHYLAAALERTPQALGLATDVSPAAARRAARAHPRMAAVVADTWAGLPVANAVVDGLLCVFAPRNADEFARVLAPGGVLALAVPGADHLHELRSAHGLLGVGSDKLETVSDALAGHFGAPEIHRVRGILTLSDDEAVDLVAMGPNAFHSIPVGVTGGAVTLDVTVARFTRAPN